MYLYNTYVAFQHNIIVRNKSLPTTKWKSVVNEVKRPAMGSQKNSSALQYIQAPSPN